MVDKAKLAHEWFDTAESDYLYAQIGLKEVDVFPQVAFLSQQVAEKLLKGYLIIKGKEPTRVHDLPKLLDECIRFAPKLEELRDACELLSGFYIEVRYPPDIPDYTKEEIEEAFAAATLVREKIRSLTQ